MLKFSLRRVFINILTTAIVSLTLASCADMFQPKIPHSGKDPASIDDLFRIAEEIDKLQSPDQFYIAPYYSSSQIRLTWTGVDGAAYYMVERAAASPVPGSNPMVWEDPDDGDYEPLERFVYGTSYTDEILRNPSLDSLEYQNKYFYRVSAYNTAKKYEESDPTVPQSAMLFRAPGGLSASGGTSVDYVELRWEHSAGAESYEIWRSDFSSGSSAAMLGTVLGNQNWYQNKVSAAEQGKDFYYMIMAKNRSGNRTLQTKPAYGYAKVFGAPDAPGKVRLVNGSGRGHSKSDIQIEWNGSGDIDVYYAVFRYSSVDSSLTRLAEKITATSWLDNVGLKPGIYYYYRVQAIIDEVGSGKALKSEFSFPDPEGFILSSPDTVIAEKSQGDIVTVKWLPAMGNENERSKYTYKIYSDAGNIGNFLNVVASEISSIPDGQGYISAPITDVPAGHTFFKVSTVNGTEESEKSIVVSPAPSAAIIQDAGRHAYIQNAAANSSGVYPVQITWKKPNAEEPAFYHVQRSTRSGSGFSRINEAALPAKGPYTDVYSYDTATGIYTFIDRNESARVGRKYYYRVLSLNQLEQGNFPSDEKIGWGALSYTQYMIEYNRTMNSALKKLTYMHKPGSTDKLGTETKNGTIGGTIYYNAALDGLGARIIIRLTEYADFYIENDPANGVYFTLNGNSNTSANMSSNGTMDGTVTCNGMYPGKVYYDKIEIRGGAAGGGTYGIEPDGYPRQEISWTVGNQ